MNFNGKITEYAKTIAVAVFCTISGGIGVYFYTQWVSSPELSLEMISQETIVEKKTDIDSLIITYNGNRLDKLSKITMALHNTGGTNFRAEDFLEPITIFFDSEVIEINIENENSDALLRTTKLSKENNKVNFDFDLLNKSERLVFSVLVSDVLHSDFLDERRKHVFVTKTDDNSSKFSIIAACRIVGIRDIVIKKSAFRNRDYLVDVILIGVVLVWSLQRWGKSPVSKSIVRILSAAMGWLSVVMVLYYFIIRDLLNIYFAVTKS